MLSQSFYLRAFAITMLTFTIISCDTVDPYQARFDECFEHVKTVEFDIEGSTKKGFGYVGFDSQCLIGAKLPRFQTVDIDGRSIETQDLFGKFTIINFWFIKCAPCVSEIPDLNVLVNKYGREDVNFLAFSIDPGHDIEEFLRRTPFLFTQVPEAETIIEEKFRLMWGYPSTLVVDEEGRIVEIFRGVKLKNDPDTKVVTAVDSLLTELLHSQESVSALSANGNSN